MIETTIECTCCGQKETVIQEVPKKARIYDDELYFGTKIKNLVFCAFTPIYLADGHPATESGLIIDKVEDFLLCEDCVKKIVKGLEEMTAKFNEEYRKLFFGKE